MVLILGSSGMLGGALLKVFPDAVGWNHGDVDVTEVESLKLKVESLKPSIIINCVAYNDVDGAEEKKELAYQINAEFPAALAALCKGLNILLVHFSSNYVFDGEQGEYAETDLPHPLSVYGQSKYQGELEIAKNTETYYIIRTSALFGPKGLSTGSKKSFVEQMLAIGKTGSVIKAVSDEVNSLTYSKDLAERIQFILDNRFPYGIYHATNSGQASWYEYAKEIFAVQGPSATVMPVPSTEFSRTAPRPKKAVLLNTKLPQMRPWQNALKEFLKIYQ